MKIIISYPPLNNSKGCATLGQNRQFQYFNKPTYIYPVVPAMAATLLSRFGHEVIWNDCLAQGWDYARFLEFISSEQPDLIAFEVKTPVVKQIWAIINDLKNLTKTDKLPKIAVFGDHVTALPDETMQNSKVDFVLTGGDYDFLLLSLAEAIRNNDFNTMEAGIYYRKNGEINNSGKFKLNHDLDALPFMDRELTHWKLYAFENGNYKRTPGTYIMSARDCWWGKCTFCSWPTLYPQYRKRSVGNVVDEIGCLINKFKIKEIMDDSGCFPTGEWLQGFCREIIKKGFNKKVYIDCNMRFGVLSAEDFKLMKKANFRLLLFGLESANQATLDQINKNLKVETITKDCRLAAKFGLSAHITVMFGYPHESYADGLKTLSLGHWLLKKGYAKTMQATMVMPYPGTALFKECQEGGLLKTLDWDKYDMKQPIIKTVSMPEEKIAQLIKSMYKISYNPEFIFRKITSLRDFDDLKYYLRTAKRVFGHVSDFN